MNPIDRNDLSNAYCMPMEKPEKFKFDDEDKKYYTLLLKKNLNIIEESQFKWKYIKEDEEEQKDLLKHAAVGGLGGCVVGAAVCLTVPVFSWMSYALYIITFGFLGAAGGVTYKFVKLQKSTAYTDWKTQTVKIDLFKKFSKFIEDDEYLKDKVCGITHELIADPLETVCNHVFEKKIFMNGLIKTIEKEPARALYVDEQ